MKTCETCGKEIMGTVRGVNGWKLRFCFKCATALFKQLDDEGYLEEKPHLHKWRDQLSRENTWETKNE